MLLVDALRQMVTTRIEAGESADLGASADRGLRRQGAFARMN